MTGEKISGRKPTVMVLGALGRCGTGACDLFTKAGLLEKNITRWDLNKTKDMHGPYEEIVQHDIFLNAIGIVADESDEGANKTYRSISLIQSRLSSITIFWPSLAVN
jgi:hypothetical protein